MNTFKHFLDEVEEMSDLQFLFVDFCIAAIVILSIVVVIGMVI